MAWSDKDDAIDWQAYFHLRNRLVVAAMHWDGDVRGLIANHFKATVKHLMCALEYSTVAIQNKAIDDFLAGPELSSPSWVGAARRAQAAQAVPGRRRAARCHRAARAVGPGSGAPPAGGRKPMISRCGWPRVCCTNCARPMKPPTSDPNSTCPPDARWFLLCKADGVTVTTADGRGSCTGSGTGPRPPNCCVSRCAARQAGP